MYKLGKELFIADTLSRAFLPNKLSTEELKSEVLAVKREEYIHWRNQHGRVSANHEWELLIYLQLQYTCMWYIFYELY